MIACGQSFGKMGRQSDWKPSAVCGNAAAGVMTTCTRRKLRAEAAMVGN